MKIKKEGKIIEIKNVKKVNLVGKFIGLMFSRRQKAKRLLFEFKKPSNINLHSWFVFFPFIAIWLDSKDNVVGLKRVKPFRCKVKIKKYFFKVIEIPVNKKNKEIVKLLVED